MADTSFEIYPAIDLRHGKVVRLQLGDPSRQTVFGEDPVAVGRQWQDAGANWVHVVNLDGAFDESGTDNWSALGEIAGLGIKVQFGGGIRSATDVERALDAGVRRVIVGTAALETPDLVANLVERFGADVVVVGIDARDGRVKTRGWQVETPVTPLNLAHAMVRVGIRAAVYTDISRDGILTGVNVSETAGLAAKSGLSVIASGGVRSLDDIEQLLKVSGQGVTGVIIGRALYDGQVDLSTAIALAAKG